MLHTTSFLVCSFFKFGSFIFLQNELNDSNELILNDFCSINFLLDKNCSVLALCSENLVNRHGTKPYYMRQNHAGQWIMILLLRHFNHLQESFSNKVTMARYVIEVTDFKSEVKFDLTGCLEAVVAFEAARRAYTSISNMHMDM